jgi:predicted nuclease of predicted toxin-antitoxin system
MRFLVDECIGPFSARWLKEQGHDVFSVFDEQRGMDDDEILLCCGHGRPDQVCEKLNLNIHD